MIDAWFSSSEITTSPASHSVGNTASFAVHADTNVYAASNPKNRAMFSSITWCGENVPQMNRTEAVPAPKSVSALRPASTTCG